MSRIAESDFIAAWHQAGASPKRVAELTGLSIRQVYARRAGLERRGIASLRSVPLTGAETHDYPYTPPMHFERRRKFELIDGTVVVFSDPHYLPDHSPVGHAALEEVCRRLRPDLVVCAGDAVDGDTVSRWDPTRGHHKRFSVREELECVKMHLDSLRGCLGKNSRLAWVLGNHDVRLSRFLAVHAPEMLEMPMTRLEDWFPHWPLSWTVEINSDQPGMTVIRHRNMPGMLHLQGLKAGAHIVHGHLHKCNVHTMPTFAGHRFSVDAGSLADPDSDAFDYAEGGPNHAQGFAVLTFRDGLLMPPELCTIMRGRAWWRGEWL